MVLARLAEVEGLDTGVGLRMLRGDGQRYQGLLRQFIELHGDDALDMWQSVECEDLPGLACQAHSLKGASGTLGAIRIQSLAGALEKAARRGDEAGQCTLLLAQLDEQLQALVDALQGILVTPDPVAIPSSSSEDLTSILLQLRGYLEEVKPHIPDAWIDEGKRDPLDGEIGIVGFEIPFNRHFYTFTPPRPLEEIDADLKACTDRIKRMIEALSA
ncbi:HPt (histidine-containing phosphotransfer) domain-containing protein [Ectothiorhodospira magna]|uniref:HPt (Histidine-containing phosphotransfer) domain-containing protein n=1 Tax=Ectothiorhodospira magna TaxID=867345 RepID=A0A1H9AYH8_9GAMM|nr:HPt (histidine-containing phosphotransfer) domain-containing protein [Ectothiorhodospira magna]